jgi:hypothetical protein
MGILVRLTGLHERKIYDADEEKRHKEQVMAMEVGNAPTVPIPEPKGRMILMATLQKQDHDPLVTDMYLGLALELLPDGANIGDEFEVQFVKVRR